MEALFQLDGLNEIEKRFWSISRGAWFRVYQYWLIYIFLESLVTILLFVCVCVCMCLFGLWQFPWWHQLSH